MTGTRFGGVIVDVEVAHPTRDEWEVHLTSSWACVGFVTRMGSVFESIDVLPPYEVGLCGDLEEALQVIYATLGDSNAPLLSAYSA
ncbi:hypothetical protein N1028_02080 [Herbiconiux sp. CPCC 203407]|uniref:Uncharacterized protein n=1 Tax=Herbiconiux oxytropis TaxID=2970915 RepID=A0AA41XDW4_9MICO|nr:hypothetical protein [Herbiconiux oxytropis]MCS5721026.1 hypothetical protein [Herbiconiux oxytropis]MCS5724678.1 hypothetical protein [Herbiconiux oxytropis]